MQRIYNWLANRVITISGEEWTTLALMNQYLENVGVVILYDPALDKYYIKR